MRKQNGFAIASVVIGVVLVGLLLVGVYALYQRSRTVASTTPLFETGEQTAQEPSSQQSPAEVPRDQTDDDVAVSDETSGSTPADETPARDATPGSTAPLTTPDKLSQTGPEQTAGTALLVGLLTYCAYRYGLSRRQLRALTSRLN